MKEILIRPNINDSALRSRLAKGMGHNAYGEIAWPNDLLYIFPVTILGVVSLCLGFATLIPTLVGEAANPFATPLEILPEWFLFPTFHMLRVIPNKLIGIVSVGAIPVGLSILPFIESLNRFQNPWRRPIGSFVFIASTGFTLYLGIAATLPL